MIKFIQRMLGMKSLHDNPVAQTLINITSGQPAWTGKNPVLLAKKGYESNVYVYASIRQITMAIAGLDWLLFKEERNGKRREVMNHAILDLLRRPNPMMGGGRFFENVTGFLKIAGDSYILEIGPDGKPPQELWVLRPDRMKVIPGKDEKGENSGIIKAFEWKAGSETKTFPAEEVLQFKEFHPTNDFHGLSATGVAIQSIDQSNASKSWNVNLLQNSALPSGALTSEKPIGAEQFDEIKSMLQNKYQGSKNAGRPLLLEGGLKWQSMGLSPQDMQWLEGQKLSAREIAIAFGVPPELIGDSTNKTFSNYREARKAFYQETVIPLANWIRGELNNWLVPKFNDESLFLDYDKDTIDALKEDRMKLFELANNSNFMEINEKRNMVGLDDKPGGDVILVPIGLVPLTRADGSTISRANGSQGTASTRATGSNKAFGIETEDQKAAYWKTFDQRRFRWEDQIFRIAQNRLDEELKAVRQAVIDAPTPDAALDAANNAIEKGKEDWNKFYLATYVGVGEDFAETVDSSFKSAAIPKRTKAQLQDVWLDTIRLWVAANTFEKIVDITNTTKGFVGTAILAGISEGEGTAKIADRISELTTLNTGRASRIARTEVISASNLGSQAAAKATNLPLEKRWLATRDGRTRGTDEDDIFNHLAADNQPRPLDQPYTVSSQSLMFPGDTSLGATAGNVINCRCTEIYNVIGEE